MKEAVLFFLMFDFTATNSPNVQLLIIARDEKPVENVANEKLCIIPESDTGILGKKKSECSYQGSNLRLSAY